MAFQEFSLYKSHLPHLYVPEVKPKHVTQRIQALGQIKKYLFKCIGSPKRQSWIFQRFLLFKNRKDKEKFDKIIQGEADGYVL